MHLSDYMAARGLTDEQVAAQIGCSRVTVSRIRRYMVRPEWTTLLALDKFSLGAVTANDFLRLKLLQPDGRRGRPARRSANGRQRRRAKNTSRSRETDGRAGSAKTPAAG
jgi:transcriptional regulator with XRE-family HTH domain